jgi:CubicO group peptidase (beta-lactamase class C family)
MRYVLLVVTVLFTGLGYSQSSPTGASGGTLPVEGYWLGTLHTPSVVLRIQLTVRMEDGTLGCSLDSLDQGSFDIPCAIVRYADQNFSFDTPAVRGYWSGRLSDDARRLTGHWTQNEEFVLDFDRQATLQSQPAPPLDRYDPAIAPVDVAGMEAVLQRDLAPALKDGELAPATSAGVAIGIYRKGVRRVLAFGTAKPDSLFEIGSITKTFTALMLAQMVEQSQVRLDESIRGMLPSGTVAPSAAPEITPLDLVTHHSGLPRMPDNFRPADPRNPYVDYTVADLYAFAATRGLQKRPDAPYLYSNVGMALMGQALADRAGLPYATLLRQKVTGPLGLSDTVIGLTDLQRQRFLPGHLSDHRLAHSWDLDAFVGAGGIRSTAGDLLRYLEAQLHPRRFITGRSPEARALSKAIVRSHVPQADAEPGSKIAFAWTMSPEWGYWHGGATGGYSSMALFEPDADIAVVVLFNTAVSDKNFADLLVQHIVERFAGKPAVSLGPAP